MILPSNVNVFRKQLLQLFDRVQAQAAISNEFYFDTEVAADVGNAQIAGCRFGAPMQPEPITDPLQGLSIVGKLLAWIDPKPDYAARFLTIEDSAGYAGLSVESVRRMLSAGKLTPLRPVRGRIVIDRHQLESVVLNSDTKPRKGRGLK